MVAALPRGGASESVWDLIDDVMGSILCLSDQVWHNDVKRVSVLYHIARLNAALLEKCHAYASFRDTVARQAAEVR